MTHHLALRYKLSAYYVVNTHRSFDCKERERVLVYLTTHGYVRRVLGPPTAAYAAGVVGE